MHACYPFLHLYEISNHHFNYQNWSGQCHQATILWTANKLLFSNFRVEAFFQFVDCNLTVFQEIGENKSTKRVGKVFIKNISHQAITPMFRSDLKFCDGCKFWCWRVASFQDLWLPWITPDTWLSSESPPTEVCSAGTRLRSLEGSASKFTGSWTTRTLESARPSLVRVQVPHWKSRA